MTNQEVCAQLHKLSPEVEVVALVGPSGELEGYVGPAEVEAIVGPMLTPLFTLADRAGQELGRGALNLLITEGSRGLVVAHDLGGGRALALVVRPGAALGLLLDDLRAAADQLNRLAA
jgi:predicted regulator of Ras-like GTPase activity (Roadblock/LC7/MglB family)